MEYISIRLLEKQLKTTFKNSKGAHEISKKNVFIFCFFHLFEKPSNQISFPLRFITLRFVNKFSNSEKCYSFLKIDDGFQMYL